MTLTNRILAAEDSPTQAAVLRGHLERAGFEVSLARNGSEALAMLHEGSFGIVVSDVVMPGIDGYELCRAIKDHDPAISVVLLTSLTDPMDVVNALAAGADNFLRKPYQPAELVHRVRNMLYNKELRQSGRTQIGLELFFLGRRYMINADREQILDLLVSTFEDLISVNQQLRDREEDLARSNDEIQVRLAGIEVERERLQAVLAALPQALAVMDADGRIIEVNENAGDLLGVTSSSLVGELVWDAVHLSNHAGTPIDSRAVEHAARGGGSVTSGTAFDVFVERSDASRVPVVARSAPVLSRDGSVVGSVGVLQDIAKLSAHDPVTGLPGHGILIERLRACTEDAATAAAGVLVVTLNRYERTREALPPGGGDQIIAEVVHRLGEALRSARVSQRCRHASAAYLGSGDVAVIATDVEGERDVIFIGEILAEEIAGSMEVGGIEVDIDVSVGVGMCAEDTDPVELVATVAASTRRLGAAGGTRVATSDPQLHAGVVARLQRESELRRGLAAGQIVAHYQPQIQLRPGHPVAVEALVRWEHPEHGLLGAGEIIPLAIDSGLISRLGWVMLEQACRQVQQWRQELPGAEGLLLSVNVAAQQLAEHDVVEQVARVLADTGLEPRALILEITETSVMSASEVVSERLRGIKALGVQIAIDDFGTGYSSLLQLRHLPIDILKIDRGFVAGMIDEPADAAIVAGTVSLARALGLELVAEGVETMDQLVQLRVLGCDVGQGFYWSRPLPPEELARWWSQQRHASSRDEPPTSPPLSVAASQDDTIAYLIHELRSPLTAITGFADLLARDGDVGGPGLLDGIRRNARELEARLASVSEARSAEHGGITLRPGRVDLVDVVRTLTHDLAPQLQPHPVSVEGGHAESVTASVDRSRLVQAITNLLTNAAKFSPGDTPIDVTVDSHDDQAVIRVRDHGPGIPAHRRPELFRRFSRLGSRNKGMGVGLYLARLIAVAHGGSLDHEPAPGGGSVFSIYLPRDSSATMTTEKRSDGGHTEHDRPPVTAPTGRPTSPVTILQIEDNDAIAQLVHKMLVTEPGIDLHRAPDGTSGLALAITHQPDIVLLDLNLPDLAGDEVLRRLRSDPRTEAAHVVVISADICPSLQEDLQSLPAVDILTKPFDIDDLLRIVADVRAGSREPTGHDPARSSRKSAKQTSRREGPLDPKTVRALHEIAASSPTPGGFEDTVRSFSADAEQRLRRLRSAGDEDDPDALSDAAHALVGLSASFGAHIAAARFRDLERIAHHADPTTTDAAMDAAIAAIREADEALQQEFCGPNRPARS